MAQHHAWRFEDGAYIETTWDRFKAGLGNTVIVQTGAYDDTVRKARLFACMHVHVALGCADQATRYPDVRIGVMQRCLSVGDHEQRFRRLRVVAYALAFLPLKRS